MKKILMTSLMLIHSSLFAAEKAEACSHWNNLLKPFCVSIYKIWTEGRDDMYFSGYAWHNRFTYGPEKIKHYNEAAWGGGLGKSRFDEKGNWQGIYAIAFLDSHSHVEPAAGYVYLKVAAPTQNIKLGAGLTFIVSSRVDINHNLPVAGILPTLAVFYKRVSFSGTYVPGTSTNGNVLFLIAKLEL